MSLNKNRRAEDGWDYLSIAQDIGYEGDKNWSREIFNQAETLLEDA